MYRSYFAARSVSGREREIFLGVLEGCTNQEIADSLGIREKTVEEHLSSLYRKIRVKTRSQAILWWFLQVKGFPSLTRKKIRRK